MQMLLNSFPLSIKSVANSAAENIAIIPNKVGKNHNILNDSVMLFPKNPKRITVHDTYGKHSEQTLFASIFGKSCFIFSLLIFLPKEYQNVIPLRKKKSGI